jgi:hypothetical protein
VKQPVRVLLVEVPSVAVEVGGNILGEVLSNHVKYPQLVLAANLISARNLPLQFEVEVVDLKAHACPEVKKYKEVDYQGRTLSIWRVGAPFGVLEQKIHGAQIVGISANFTFERGLVAQTIEFLNRKTCALIVVGGHDATADPRYYLERGADVCVLGEGETALQEIAVAQQRGDLSVVPGIAFLDRGQLRKNGKRTNHDVNGIAYPDCDLLTSFQFDQCPDGPLPRGVDPRMAVIETSRGCDERCSFCDTSFIVGKYRPMRLQSLYDRVEAIESAHIKTILFADDNLLYRILPHYGGRTGRQDLLLFFNHLFERRFAWTFYNGLQFGLLEKAGTIDLELIEALFKNELTEGTFRGCFRAYIPLEKFTEIEMDLLPKLRSIQVEQEIVGCIARMKVPELNLGFIIANIRETPSTLQETENRAREFGAIVQEGSSGQTVPRFFPWCSVPIPGTPDYKNFSPHILYPASEFPELYSNYTSVLANDFFSPLDFTLERARISEELNNGISTLHTVTLDEIASGRASDK